VGLSWLGQVISFLFGISAGSFLNVCIHRLPRDMSVVRPPSRCPHCLKRIRWYDNIPLLSYLILRARCRNCKARISPRYFLIELATGIVFVLFYRHYILSGQGAELAQGIIYLALTCSLIVASLVDIEHHIAPDEVTLRGIILAPLVSLLYPKLHAPVVATGFVRLDSLIACGVGIAVGAGVFYALGVFGKIVFRRQAMGFGDVKLMGFLGGFLGWKVVLLVFFFGAFFGVIWGVATRSRVIPYVPSLSLALLMVMLWDKPLRILNRFIVDFKMLIYLWRHY
jgi:leader peptidase (prepilin peptidase)/N-methyltransferase